MFRSVKPYLEAAGIDDPVICYQGAVVADPTTGPKQALLRPRLVVRESCGALGELRVEG